MGMQSVTNSFRTAYGLFYKARFRPIIMVIINIIVSVILVGPLGISGVLIGTIVSRILTVAWLDPYIVYKYGFQDSPKKYYQTYIYYLIIFLIGSIILFYICSFIHTINIFTWIIMAIIILLFYNLALYLLFSKTREFQFFYQKGYQLIKKMKRRNV